MNVTEAETLLRELLAVLRAKDSGPMYATVTVRHPREMITRIETILSPASQAQE